MQSDCLQYYPDAGAVPKSFQLWTRLNSGGPWPYCRHYILFSRVDGAQDKKGRDKRFNECRERNRPERDKVLAATRQMTLEVGNMAPSEFSICIE